MTFTDTKSVRQFYETNGLVSTDERDACGVGFIYSTTGPTYEVIRSALKALENISHRGVTFSDEKTGDGAGIRTQLPRDFRTFLAEKAHEEGFADEKLFREVLGQSPHVAIGQFFFNRQDEAKHRELKRIAENRIRRQSHTHFLWRPVPLDLNYLGPHALVNVPAVEQLILPVNAIGGKTEASLYILRQLIEHDWQKEGYNQGSSGDAYICSLSADSIVYKGMSLANNVQNLYPDLKHSIWANIEWALIHQRMSTNTTSTADKAHPYRIVAHNGEINTLRGNIIFFLSRMKQLVASISKEHAAEIDNVIQQGASDTATFDNIVELLIQSGMSLPTAISTMIPSVYGWNTNNHKTILTAAQDISIPWDGPVAMVAISQNHVVAVRDRNGLRPLRLLQTKSGLVIGGSEMGMIPLAPEEIAQVIPLRPGDKFAIDRKTHQILLPAAVEALAARELEPVAHRIIEREKGFSFKKALPSEKSLTPDELMDLFKKQAAAHYTIEHIERILDPMIMEAKEPTWSMGDDTALAVFEENRALDFFYSMMKQQFAQVTNPSTDSINERGGMISIGSDGEISLNMPLGHLGAPLPTPLLWYAELENLENRYANNFARMAATYYPGEGPQALRNALHLLRDAVERHVRDGKNQIILTHQTDDPSRLPIPMPLAMSAVHSDLSQKGLRGGVALHALTEEFIDTHKLAMLLSSGANFVTPYLLEKTIAQRYQQGLYKGIMQTQVYKNFRKAANEGFLKIIAKMGIAVPASYVGGYNISLIGLDTEDAKEFFPWTISPIGGITLEQLQERKQKHAGIAQRIIDEAESSGIYSLAKGTSLRRLKPVTDLEEELFELHMWGPEVVEALQECAINNSTESYEKLVALQDFRREKPIVVRDVLDIKYPEDDGAVSLDNVEAVENILDRFCSGGISLGAFSPWVHRDVAKALNNIRHRSKTGEGPKSSSGEGGENTIERRFQDSSTLIKQIASGRFGAHALYLRDAGIIEIKVAQGAKPGEGGQLPGAKVEGLVAQLRHATPGVGLISPPPHHDIYSIEDLTQLIYDLKCVNPEARVRVKLVSQPGIGQVAVGVAKARADEIHIAGHSGGTGASPLSSIKNAGCPVEIGLAEVHQALKANNLRSHVRLIADGGVIIGDDIVKLMMLGADEVGVGTANAVAMGCVMTHKCHLNVCPAGIATQRPELEAYYKGQPQFIENYYTLLANDVRAKLARLGLKKITDIVGRTDLLAQIPDKSHVDLRRLLALHESEEGHSSGARLPWGERFEPPPALDHGLLQAKQIVEFLSHGKKISRKVDINNTHLSVGSHIAGLIVSELILNKINASREGLSPVALKEAIAQFKIPWPTDDALTIEFTGNAGQSFGAFMVPGMKFVLSGAANDYVGKDMMGGKIVVRPHPASVMAKAPDENEIGGSTILYGATGGEAYISGKVRERFMVRGSGVRAVVEGCGDYGCEYMSGGIAVILGETGQFFGSGMKGGLAFIYDADGTAASRINHNDVKVYALAGPQTAAIGNFEQGVKSLIENHWQETGSPKAARILANWETEKLKFRFVVPKDILKLIERPGDYKVNPAAFFDGQPAAIKPAQPMQKEARL